MLTRIILLASAGAALLAVQPGAVETAVTSTGFPAEWPAGPPRDAAPSWARAGKIRFARWDGGRIETAKAFLSGWPGFNPPIPDYVDSMTNWYSPRSLELLSQAHINAIWVTFSVGFSIASERAHMDQVRDYIAECHRRGIRVFAYQSIANLFWEDMFAHEPQSKNWVRLDESGQPTPYGAGAYAKMGRVTRYMARIAHPEWQSYLRRRVDLALDAGADGIFFDNNFNEHLAETYAAIYRYAASRKRDVLLMGNFHENSYVLNRLTNALSTEDGLEPGVYQAEHISGRLDKSRPALVEVAGGFLVNNLGLFRLHEALSDGWKPFLIEHGHRETGERFSTPISGPRHQLAIAEAAASGGALELFSEGAFADGLLRGRPEAMSIWRDIAAYHRFLADNEELYVGARSGSRAAVILDERSEGVPLLNGLAARNVQFDVIYEHDLTPEKLKPYGAVALLGARAVRERALAAIEGFRGSLFASAEAATADERGRRRERPAFLQRATVWEATAPVDDIAAALQAAAAAPVRVEAPAGVVHVVREQPGRRRLVHLLNYSGKEAAGVTVTVQGDCQRATVHSPDPQRASGVSRSGACKVEIARLGIYAVVVFE